MTKPGPLFNEVNIVSRDPDKSVAFYGIAVGLMSPRSDDKRSDPPDP